MTMVPSPSGKVLTEPVTDRAPPQSHISTDWIDGNIDSTRRHVAVTKLSINRNETGHAQSEGCKTSYSINTVPPPQPPPQSQPPLPPVKTANAQQSQDLGQKTDSRGPSAVRGISQEPSLSSLSKDINRSNNISIDRIPQSHASTTPSPIFTIAHNQEPPILQRSDSVLSRSSSQQAKYHESCIPQVDPTLIIGHTRRTPSPKPRNKRPPSFKRPGSQVSLLSRRESVTNLIFSGPSTVDQTGEDSTRWETVYKQKLSFGTFSYASSLFSRMGSPLREPDVTPGEFDVMEDDDYSTTRQSKVSNASPTRRVQPLRTGFLYQATSFDYLSKDVPSFVKSYAQKNGKLLTESFILRVNYLRRRRQLGEVTNTINIGNNNMGSNKRPTTSVDKHTGSPR